jgi:hypothetical protein
MFALTAQLIAYFVTHLAPLFRRHLLESLAALVSLFRRQLLPVFAHLLAHLAALFRWQRIKLGQFETGMAQGEIGKISPRLCRQAQNG